MYAILVLAYGGGKERFTNCPPRSAFSTNWLFKCTMDRKTKRFRVVSEDICTTEDRISKTKDFRYMFVLRLYCECTVFALFFKILYSFRKYRLYSGWICVYAIFISYRPSCNRQVMNNNKKKITLFITSFDVFFPLAAIEMIEFCCSIFCLSSDILQVVPRIKLLYSSVACCVAYQLCLVGRH